MTLFLGVFFLLVLFEVKHFLSDYVFQTRYMLGKFKPGWDFFPHLLAHAAGGGLCTFCILVWLTPDLWWLAFVDTASHFLIDRMKAGPRYLGRFKALSANEMGVIMSYKETCGLKKFRSQLRGNTLFWWSLGLDQMLHRLVHYYIIWRMVQL